MVLSWGETPYEDLDGFKHLKKFPAPNRQLIDELEEDNMRSATLKYLSASPSLKIARFDYGWFLQLHEEMYGDVWEYTSL